MSDENQRHFLREKGLEKKILTDNWWLLGIDKSSAFSSLSLFEGVAGRGSRQNGHSSSSVRLASGL